MKQITKIITVYDDGSTTIQDFYTAPMPLTPSPWNPSAPYGPIKNNCPKCGLKLEGVMGYVCPNNPCPTGLGGVHCGVSNDIT